MAAASTYWYFSVLDRVGTRDTAAIIREFEQSEFELFAVQLKMQSANHQATMSMAVSRLIFPNRWYEQAAGWDTAVSIPAEEIWRPETTSAPAQIQADERGSTSPTRLPMYLSQALHGLTYGMLLFLVASGLTLIFGMMGVLNIAHASFFMLAAYFSFQVLRVFDNFFVALPSGAPDGRHSGNPGSAVPYPACPGARAGASWGASPHARNRPGDLGAGQVSLGK